ncbi:MAG: acetate kinase [Candidatus Omnitrophica bacterium]|nr:acetate kinase [Candidatus Omnitrophota bacterium]MDD5573799.1 acetate kinase [Candidatus Omnitrophota bacterium]
MISRKILVINSGSSSIKYRLFNAVKNGDHGASFRLLTKGLIEKIGHKDSNVHDHREGIQLVLQNLTSGRDAKIKDLKEIWVVGHRIVHGGVEFKKPTLITSEVMAKIRECFELAPLHNPANYAGVEACQAILPDTRQVAVFDTAFHQTLPEHAYIYGLPYEYYEKYNLRKYGFHGTSHQYVAHEAARILEKPLRKLRLITCHLGNGCSITAVKHGQSVDTSMGFTPLEGLVMGTRCGDIDPASVIFLAGKEKTSLEEIDRVLNYKSGLKGISGLSNDMREIWNAAKEGHHRAKLAFDIFTYRIKKYIGSYIAAMGGVDAIVFTAGIGENEAHVRQRITKGLFEFLSKKKVKVLVIPTNEELMIAKQAFHVVNS